MLNQIDSFLRSCQSIAVTSHSRPDGDSLGSSLALALALKKLGKQAIVLQADPPPPPYAWLPGVDGLKILRQVSSSYDCVVVLECSDLSRTGIEGLHQSPVINIDHHSQAGDFGRINWIDSTAAAVGEMVYDLILAMGVPLDSDVATNLYTAIITDTGSFHYSATSQRTFEITAELVKAGANPGQIAREVFMSQPLSKVRLLARVLDTLQLHAAATIATITLTQDMLKETEARPDDTEGIVGHALSIDSVMMVAFLRELAPATFRVSLRSKLDYDVGGLAKRLGGGGHTNASGVTLKGNLAEVQHQITSELTKLLR